MNCYKAGSRVVRAVSPVLLALALTGCITTDKAVPGARADLLEFLKDGSTTMSEAVLTLGQPTSVLERQNILTFRIGEDVNNAYYVVGPESSSGWLWEKARYSLVLVFDGGGVMQRHNLVLIK